MTLSSTQNLILTIQFNPTVAGSVNGSVSIVSNASGSPATVSLTGTGVVPVQHSVALSWTASTRRCLGTMCTAASQRGADMKIHSSLVAGLSYRI